MRPLGLKILCLFAALSGGAMPVSADSVSSQDVIMIASIAPKIVASGEEVEVTIRIAYNLVSRPTGAIRITANYLEPNDDHVIASQAIESGMDELTIKAALTPRYWSPTVSFGVNAALLVSSGADLRTKALSIDRLNLQVQPPKAEKIGVSVPDPVGTYVDGLSIVSVRPESFGEGVEQEIVVVVAYELLSRERGRVSLSINGEKPAVRYSVTSERVDIGKGEVTLRGMVSPQKTAGLPIGRLLVTLGEFPAGKRSVPLAWDEATIGVD